MKKLISISLRITFIILLNISAVIKIHGQNSALALSWTGAAETNIEMDSLNLKEHTISMTFMPQFIKAYDGPLMVNSGNGRFFLGMNYFNLNDGVSLALKIGSQSHVYLFPMERDKWYRVAVSCTPVTNTLIYRVFVNGEKQLDSIVIPQTDPNLPSGKIRLGNKMSPDGSNVVSQFYGLIDDIVIFNRALASNEIQRLHNFKNIESINIPELTTSITESINFSKKNFQTSGVARTVQISAQKNSAADKSKLLLPEGHTVLTLPFKHGDEWKVIQAFDGKGKPESSSISHFGNASFCWDFIRVNNETRGAPIYAPATGMVSKIQQNMDTGTVSNIVEIKLKDKEYTSILHILKNSAFIDTGDQIRSGQPLALTGDVGSPNNYHIHFAASNLPDRTSGFLTIPVAFSNYERKNSNGRWEKVTKGMPENEEIIRVPAANPSPFSVVSTWENVNAREKQVYNVPFDEYKALYDEHWEKGWRLHTIQAIPSGNHPNFTAVWRRGSYQEKQVYATPYDNFRKLYDEIYPDGYRIKLLDVVVIKGVPLYTAVWIKSNEQETQVYGVSMETFKTRYDDLWKKDWRIKSINPYIIGKNLKYTVIFTKGNAAEKQMYSVSHEQFIQRNSELWNEGWRIKQIKPLKINNKMHYTVVYERSARAELSSFHIGFSNYIDRYHHLWKDGWRIKQLQMY